MESATARRQSFEAAGVRLPSVLPGDLVGGRVATDRLIRAGLLGTVEVETVEDLLLERRGALAGGRELVRERLHPPFGPGRSPGARRGW